MSVSSIPLDFYVARSRFARAAEFTLSEENSASPSEKLLQAVWNHQRLVLERLKTTTGERVKILHPGFWNSGPGPDFQKAVLQIGNLPPETGDVELDLDVKGWNQHGHAQNPSFNQVKLHVVWEPPARTVSAIPVLCLQGCLDSPVPQLVEWFSWENLKTLPECLKGTCSAPLKLLSTDQVRELLEQASLVRLRQKAALMEARARQVGTVQTFWEFLFRALGYKQNVWPMQKLGENLPLMFAAGDTPLQVQARLLGVAGFLPSQLTWSGRVNENLRSLWDVWWRERDALESILFPASIWNFNSLRPVNHPMRRLAIAAHWIADPDLLLFLEQWFWGDTHASRAVSPLLHRLNHYHDSFWSHRYGFFMKRVSAVLPFVGRPRLTDIVMNVLLPWFWMRSTTSPASGGRKRAEELFLNWPRGEDNTVLRLARRRLWGEAKHLPVFLNAATQQGLMQVVRDFCSQTDSLCSNCRFPGLVSEISPEVAGLKNPL